MLPYEIDPQALATLLKQNEVAHGQTAAPQFVLLDVREPWEYATAHLEGSVLMPMGKIPSRALQELSPACHIVTLCHSGVRSMSVALWLRKQGFEQTQSLAGGIDAWSRLVDPSVPRY